VKWEYAFLKYTSSARERPDKSWIWTTTAALGLRGTLVALWHAQAEADRPPDPVGFTYNWVPDPANSGIWQQAIRDVTELLGDEGWELVTMVPENAVMRQDSQYGWDATHSLMLTHTYAFKRQASNPEQSSTVTAR
jgi:hypothetical protein